MCPYREELSLGSLRGGEGEDKVRELVFMTPSGAIYYTYSLFIHFRPVQLDGAASRKSFLVLGNVMMKVVTAPLSSSSKITLPANSSFLRLTIGIDGTGGRYFRTFRKIIDSFGTREKT